MTENDIKEAAFEWHIDYKPGETNLSPQEYGQYGFEQGMKKAFEIPGIHYDNKLPKMQALCRKLNELMAEPNGPWDLMWHTNVRTAIQDLHHLMNEKGEE